MCPHWGIKISVSNFGVIPPKILEVKTYYLKFAILQPYCQSLQIATRYRKSENGVANCNVSLVLSLNPVYFGPQRRKMGMAAFSSIERPGGHQSGLASATHSSFNLRGSRLEKVTGAPYGCVVRLCLSVYQIWRK